MDFSSDAPSSSSSFPLPESSQTTESSPAARSSGYGGLGTPEYPSQGSWTSARHSSIAEPVEHKKKRPGPKRDAKPAPSEKLERNRQAQRSHRERKELYTKELEAEVQRLKDMYIDTVRERDQAVNAGHACELENRRLQEELRQLREQAYSGGVSTATLSPADSYSNPATRHSSFSVGPTSGGGNSASLMDYETSSAVSSVAPYREHMPASFGTMGTMSSDHVSQHQYQDNPSPRMALSESGSSFRESGSRHGSTVLSPTQQQQQYPQQDGRTPTSSVTPQQPQQQMAKIDYDELALDFVLTLERPCMAHAHYLMVRAHNKESQDPAQNGGGDVLDIPDEVPRDDENQHISGHTLMASVPSHRHIMEHPNDVQEMSYPEGIQRKDLLRLLGLTSQLGISEAELPPVKAWLRVLQNPRLRELSVQDFADLKAQLLEKVHCYRFGAVITEDDIVGTVDGILQEKAISCM